MSRLKKISDTIYSMTGKDGIEIRGKIHLGYSPLNDELPNIDLSERRAIQDVIASDRNVINITFEPCMTPDEDDYIIFGSLKTYDKDENNMKNYLFTFNDLQVVNVQMTTTTYLRTHNLERYMYDCLNS